MYRLILFILVCIAEMKTENSFVRTTSGTLHGKSVEVFGNHVQQFLGVPYALPPLGDLRFKAPVPYQNEERIIDSTQFAPICYQPPHAKNILSPLLRPSNSNMSEDCLYLNVYVPLNRGENKAPVMVWLAGEGFSYADPTQFDGSYLASVKNIIVVTVSYRVSVFGFLNGVSQEAPGNAGLLDQRLALKWLKDNIEAFGGDSNKITLSGRFSGAMSAVIHTFSPLSTHEKLFERIILHSGVPDGKWIFNSNPLNAAMDLTQIMACVYSNFSVSISCLKKVPAEDLLKAANTMQDEWRPSLDFTLISKSSLSELVKASHSDVDILIGTNKDEGSFCLNIYKVFNSTLFNLIEENKLPEPEYKQLMSELMFSVFREKNPLVDAIASFTYAADNRASQRQKFVEFCGDLYVNAFSGKLADLMSEERKKLYVYELSHRPSFSKQPDFVNAGHGDDVLYALGLPLQLKNLPEEELQLTKTILEAISNFIHNGNPNSRSGEVWPSYTTESKLVRKFSNHPEADEIAQSSSVKAVRFWQDLVPSLFRHGCPPPPVTAALIDDSKETDPGHGTWLTLPVAEYIIVGLICATSLLLIAVVIALVVILRHSSSVFFRRLK